MIARGADRAALSILVTPLHGAVPPVSGRLPVAAIFVTDPDRVAALSRDHVRDLFGLTRAEAGLAAELIEGDGLQSAATRLGITRETARTHLKHIFEKTGVRRQTELVRLLVASSGGLRQD